MAGGVCVQQAYSLDEISLPLGVAITKTRHQLGEVVPINTVVLEDTVYQSHQSHSTTLEVLQRAIQMHDAIFDLLGNRVHRIDV